MKAEIEKLFHDLADLPSEARSRYFAEHTVDEETRREVEALLAFDPGASSFLSRDISIAASHALPELEGHGYRCGPYRLIRLIGRGGMGAVYLAERKDADVKQNLAIKLLPLGAGNPQRERFLQERQILASLTHPNIARMLDAGHLENGQPYLVMEYVDGQPIDVFARELPLRAVISLFLKVCSAVAHLHRNLVVHRDLKPANILVTQDGEPKLLDFGIAKILDLAEDPTLTSFRMLTPHYASPEQVTGGRISTAVDIYSLGVVLYFLLTGRPVHDFEDRSPEAITRVITSREVTRPSRWVPELKGDLESVLLKALRKDPHERYATVDQFADDIKAYLESRPVRVRSADRWYRARKFIRRHWIQVTASAAVILSLAAGAYIADRQRARAETRLALLRRLSEQMLAFEVQLSVPGAGSSLELHRKLAATAIQYLESIGPNELQDKTLALELGEAYLRVARIQGVPEWNHEGQYREAERTLTKVAEIAGGVLIADPSNREALWLVANAAHDRAIISYTERRPQDVFTYSPKVVDGFDRLARLGNLTRREVNAATYIYGDLAEVHTGLHRYSDAVRYARMGIDYSRNTSTVPGPRAQAFNMLAGALTNLGDLQGALQATSEARRIWEQLRHDEGDSRYTRIMLYQTRCQEGLLLGEDGGVNLNRPKEAVLRLQEAFDALEDDTRIDRNDYECRSMLATAGLYLGDVLRHTDPKRALEVYDHALARIREIPGDIAARRAEARLLADSSYAARWIHRGPEAKERIAEAFRLLHNTGDYPAGRLQPRTEVDAALRAQADDDAETGHSADAVEMYEKVRAGFKNCDSCAENDLNAAVSLSLLDSSLSKVYRRLGQTDAEAAAAAERRDLWQRWNRRLPNNSFVQQQLSEAAPAAR